MPSVPAKRVTGAEGQIEATGSRPVDRICPASIRLRVSQREADPFAQYLAGYRECRMCIEGGNPRQKSSGAYPENVARAATLP